MYEVLSRCHLFSTRAEVNPTPSALKSLAVSSSNRSASRCSWEDAKRESLKVWGERNMKKRELQLEPDLKVLYFLRLLRSDQTRDIHDGDI